MSTSAARLAVALLLCLPAAVACDDTGGGGSSVGAGGRPAPDKGGGGGSEGGDGGLPGPLRIPEWGRNGFLFDDDTATGRANWEDIKKLFEGACKDGTLCVVLERVYREESGALTDGPCGYDHVEPAAETLIERGGTVSVVGVCGTDTEGPTDPPDPIGTTGPADDPEATAESAPSPSS